MTEQTRPDVGRQMDFRFGVLAVMGLLFLVAGLTPAAPATLPGADAMVLTGDTSDPDLSTFVLGEPVELRFAARGLAPGQALSLKLRILDEHDQLLAAEQIPVTADLQGQWKGKLAAPSDRLGFRRVEAELSNGVKLQALGTRKAGYLTYAVLPDPAQRLDYGGQRTRFGMQGGFGPWGNRSLALLGARWVLDGNFEWRRNEPDRPGQYAEALAKKPQGPAPPRDWNTYALPTLMATPKWAAVPETFSYMTGTLKPEYEKAWQDYCRQAVAAFVRKYPDQKHRVYQVTWEPQPPWGFKGKLADLVRIYELAYPAIHEADPEAIVGGPTLGLQHGEDVQATADVFAAGLARYLDAYTTHPYFSMDPERDGMIQRLRAGKRILAATGKRLPMYGTEQGQSTFERRELELKHAQAVLRQNLITLGEGFDFNMTYYIVDYHLANQSGYGYYYNLVDGVPWGPKKAGPRPIVPAYAAQSLLLDGSDAVRPINWLGSTAWGYAFERDGQVTLALWDYGEEPRQVRLPVGAPRVTLYDWMGNAQELATDRARAAALTLGPEPVYLTGVSAALWGSAGKDALALAQEELTVAPDAEVTVEATVTAPQDRPVAGAVVVRPDPRLGIERREVPVSVQPGQRAPLQIGIKLPAGVEPGNYPVQFSIESGSETQAMAGQWLRVVAPVTVERVRPLSQADGTPALRITLHDVQGTGQQGQMSVRVQELMGDAKTVPFSLAAGQTDTFTVALPGLKPDPAKRYAVRVLTPPDGPEHYAQTHHANWFAPPAMTAPPEIDGEVADWQGPVTLEPPGQPSAGRKAPDLFIVARLSWDENAVYVAAEVTDDVFLQDWDEHNTWRGDSVTVSFNLDPDRDDVASGNELADAARRARKTSFTAALTKEGVEVYRYKSHDDEALPTGLLPREQIPAAVRQDGKGTTYELAIPWSAMGGEAPTPGQLIAVAVGVRDLDETDWHKGSSIQFFKASSKDAKGDSGLVQLGPPGN